MKRINFLMIPLFWMTALIINSCREPLVSSADERMERLILGDWMLQSSDPPREGTIALGFSSDQSEQLVHIVVINPSSSNEYDFHYRIEDGDLYFLTVVEDDHEIEFIYDIKELTEFVLILSFAESSSQRVTQTYVRP